MNPCLYESAISYGNTKEAGVYALASVCHTIFSKGGVCNRAKVALSYPKKADKKGLYQMEKEMRRVCKEKNIALESVQYYSNPLLNVPCICVTGIGVGERIFEPKDLKNLEIVQCGNIGISGMLQILNEKEKELKQTFAMTFLEQIRAHEKNLFGMWEHELANMANIAAIYPMGEGGIFATFYEIAKETGAGLAIDMKKILVLQETIEVCERFRMNPYQMSSTGAFLLLCEQGDVLVDCLHNIGMEASVIGRTTKNADKIMYNGEDVRYVDRPASDEIYKIFKEEL